ncbi:MAG: amino acid ABC transporter permease [Candidatus Binatia bacterium]|nr:MAG: amino acid ABC transporter permease [Candidatus Binatia bacterium]
MIRPHRVLHAVQRLRPLWPHAVRALVAILSVVPPLLHTTVREATADQSLTRVLQRGTLRWGGDLQGGEPYVFRDPQEPSRLVGFEVELVEAVARELGVAAQFVQNDWSTLLASLERGNFDVAVNGIEVTPARASAYALTRPYASFEESLIVRREVAPSIRSLGDCAGKRVGTLANSLAHHILGAEGGIRVVLYEGVDEPLTDVSTRRLDAVLIDDIIARRYLPAHPDLVEVLRIPGGSYAMALRQQDASLRNAISAALDALEQRGELQAILRRWGIALPGKTEISMPAPADTALAQQVSLFLRAAGVTLILSSVAMVVAIFFGALLSIARSYGSLATATIARAYIEVIRGTPVLLQLYVLYYGLASLFAMDAFTTAVLGLGLNYAAYEAELYRAGLQAVPKGQVEAALALGMSRWVALRRIVLPQAIRTALPGMANDFIALLKDSSIVSVITVVELTKQMTITAVDVRSWLLPGILCAALYLAMSLPLSRLASHLEKKLSMGL